MKKVIEHFKKNGYAVLQNFISSQRCNEAIAEIDKLIRNFQPTKEQMLAFTPGTQSHFKSQYFKESANQVSFFFQPKALKDGALTVPKEYSVNKVGHALHQKNKIFQEITFNDQIHQICEEIGISNPIVVQSMAILKPPKIGGEVPDHQDSTFLYGDPDTLVGFWIPLQDATLNNGCLWGIPGSHKGKLYRRSKHFADKSYVEELYPIDYQKEQFVPLQMKRGSLAFFQGKFIHRSNDNFSQKSRYAYTWHLMDKKSKWSPQNWLQRQEFPKLERNMKSINNKK